MFVGAALATYAVFVGAHFSSGFGGADVSGYINSARLLSRLRLTTPMIVAPEIETKLWHYCPLGFTPREETRTMAPIYPLGLPLQLAIVGTLGGWHWGPLALYVAGTCLTVVCCYGSSRELGVDPVWALGAAGMLAISPMLLWSSEHMMSDGPATTWNAIAFYAALRGRRSRIAAGWCGVALAMSVMVRPTNVMILPALAVVLWERKKLIAACVGGLPLAALLAAYNTLLWRKPWRTGYANHHELFEWSSFGPTVEYYVHWIPHLLPIAVVGVACIAFLDWRRGRRELTGLILWAGAFIGLYAFYPFTRLDWWWSRFVLPAYPALAVLGALGLQRLAATTDRWGRPLVAAVVGEVLVLASIGLSVRDWRVLDVYGASRQNEIYQAATHWFLENTPENSVVATLHLSGSLTHYGRLIVRWDMLTPEDWDPIVAAARRSGRPIYFCDWSDRVDEAMRRTPGAWKKLTQFEHLGVWRLALE